MRDVEVAYMETYKRVDAICRDMLRNEHYFNAQGTEVYGLSAYIAAMAKYRCTGRSLPASWNESYRTLKHLRWIRNRITHDVGSSECEESDLDSLNAFYRQIMTQTDALALAYKSERIAQEKPTYPYRTRQTAFIGKTKTSLPKYFLFLAVVLLLLIALVRCIH